jgi:hypothetical protein
MSPKGWIAALLLAVAIAGSNVLSTLSRFRQSLRIVRLDSAAERLLRTVRLSRVR